MRFEYIRAVVTLEDQSGNPLAEHRNPFMVSVYHGGTLSRFTRCATWGEAVHLFFQRCHDLCEYTP